MRENWLHSYLLESVRRNMCVNIACTTCGANEFRRGVLNALVRYAGNLPSQHFDYLSAMEVANVLSEVEPSERDAWKLEGAVRCLLFDLAHIIGEQELALILDRSWGGAVLYSMQEHYKARQSEARARQEHEDRINVQKRHEEKKRQKQERHRQRLALKKERDRIWREKHGKLD